LLLNESEKPLSVKSVPAPHVRDGRTVATDAIMFLAAKPNHIVNPET
jgi:hypothetical protein